MTATAETVTDTAVVTQGEVRGSYVHVFEPKTNQLSGNTEYSMSLLIPKSDTATVDQLKAAANAALTAKWPDKNKRPPNLRNPLRDGDTEKFLKGSNVPDPEYAGHYFINCKSKNRPGIVKLSQGKLVDVDDPREFQSGDYCRVSLNAYAYDAVGNRGVAFGLNNVMVTRKGEPLGGGARPAKDDFAGFASASAADANDDDLFS